MPQLNVYTRVLQQDGIQIKMNEATQQKGVFATRDLPPRHLILLEQTLVQTRSVLIDIVAYRSDMFDELYPRSKTWAACGDHEERQRLAGVKLNHNTFAYVANAQGEAQSSLGILISTFNHACDPNAVLYETGGGGDSFVTLTTGYTTRAIQEGEEVCITYGTGTVHAIGSQHPYKCPCSYPQLESVKRAVAAIRLAEETLTTPPIARIVNRARVKSSVLFTSALQAVAGAGYFRNTSNLCIAGNLFRMAAYLEYPTDTPQVALHKHFTKVTQSAKEAYLSVPGGIVPNKQL
jgi:hypothetical protein